MKNVFSSFLLVCLGFTPLFAQDTTPPIARAKASVFIDLGPDGIATLSPEQVNDGSTDDVTIQENLRFSLSKTSFDCADIVKEEWRPVGQKGFSADLPFFGPGITIANDGTPYVIYMGFDPNYTNLKSNIQKWTGTDWEHVGEPMPSLLTSFDFFIAPDGTPYFAYIDRGRNEKIVVLKWTGSSWEDISITLNAYAYASVNIESPGDGVIYLAYADLTNSKKLTLQWLNGSNWELLNGPEIIYEGGWPHSLSFSTDGTLYVGYTIEENDNNLTTILRWDGNQWETLGGGNYFSESGLSFSISPDNTPYIIYNDVQTEEKFKLVKWDGSTWGVLGRLEEDVNSSNYPYFTNLVIGRDGIPYVTSHVEGSTEEVVNVLRWNGAFWESIGISAGRTHSSSLAVAQDGTLYIAYEDMVNGDKLTVQKFRQTSSVTLFVEDEAGNISSVTTPVRVEDKLPPAMEANKGHEFKSEGDNRLSPWDLRFSDNCSPASETQYTITTPPAYGHLELVNNPGTATTSFTQQDINSNELRYVVTDATQTSDQFAFTVTDANGNITDEQLFFIGEKALTGLFDKEFQNLGFQIHPNPTNGRVTISLGDEYAGEELMMALTDLSGRMLMQQKGSLVQCQEKVSDFLEGAKAGVFLLQLKVRDNLRTVKVVRQ